jgi:hypothetical protein
MGNTTRINEMYIIATNINMLNEESNEYQIWGECGITKNLINISNVGEFVEPWYNAEGF